MTIHDDRNDPNLRRDELRRMDRMDRRNSSPGLWIIGALAALFVLGLIVWSVSGDRTTTASSPPATPPATTGTAPAERTTTPPPATPTPAPQR
jgi:hypothetical protein